MSAILTAAKPLAADRGRPSVRLKSARVQSGHREGLAGCLPGAEADIGIRGFMSACDPKRTWETNHAHDRPAAAQPLWYPPVG